MVPCPRCDGLFWSEMGVRIHRTRMHGERLSNRPERHHANRCINLTSERVQTFTECRDALAASLGVPPESLSGQKVVSACMDSFLAAAK